MKTGRVVYLVLFIVCVGICCNGITLAANSEKEQKTEKAEKAKVIQVDEAVTTDHPEYEEGIACNDCHEMKLDAQTTATQVWLTGESPGRAAGEGVMPQDALWKEIEKIIGGIKMDSKTFVLGTSLNNTPLTTTAEFTLDPAQKALYGFHEMGTAKLHHIRANPKVSLNWHKEFETFTDFLCVQVIGRAELIDGQSKEFEQIMIDLLPYENGARVPKDATPQQREERLKKFRESLTKGFVISKITIDQVTIATMDFVKDGFRRYQRWTRQ
jgi:nitroimidazol reductase NimA-like FMN-containing flavoprotein (pyridoxamine 5'-phosphate oxidase superfamily)